MSKGALALGQALATATYYAPLVLSDFPSLFYGEPDNQEIFAALEELVAAQILVGSGDRYNFSQRSLAEAVRRTISPERLRQLHSRLARTYEANGSHSPVITAYHYQQAGEEDKALKSALSTSSRTRLTDQVFLSPYSIEVHERALRYAEQQKRPVMELYKLRKALVQLSAFVDPLLVRYADAMIEQLRCDTGLIYMNEANSELASAERALRCLERAQQRREQTPEAERGLEPLQAIKELAVCVTMMGSAYGRAFDMEKMERLPFFLEPFRSLSPAIDMVCQVITVIIFRASQRRSEKRLRELLEQLAQPVPGLDEVSREGIRYALQYYYALDDAVQGKSSAFSYAEMMLQHPNYAALGWQIRMLAHLARGESRQATECREHRELLAIQNVEANLHLVNGVLYEAGIYAFIGDLLELKRVLDTVGEYAEKHPGWRPHLYSIRGAYHWLRGELDLARAELERTLSIVSAGAHSAWWNTVMRYMNVLLDQKEYELARSVGNEIIQKCERGEVDYVHLHFVEAGLALAEARLGEYAKAIERIDRILARAKAEGVEGILLGNIYEARVRIAIMQKDLEAFDKYLKLTADIYLPGKSGPLAAKYYRIVEEARRAGLIVSTPAKTELGDEEVSSSTLLTIATAAVRSELDNCQGPELRARRALDMLVEYAAATAGYLYGIKQSGLALLSSGDNQAPPAGLDDKVKERLLLEMKEEDTMAMDADDFSEEETDAFRFVDTQGNTYQLIALTCRKEGQLVIIGIAALKRSSDKPLRLLSFDFVSAIAEGLLGAGDVTATTV